MINGTIDVVLETGTHKYGDYDESYELIHLVLNGETVKGTFDAFEFQSPRTKKRTSFLMTCSCGVPDTIMELR